MYSEKHFQDKKIFDTETSPMKEAYRLLAATTPLELSELYTKQDQLLFASRTWDYDVPDQIPNRIKSILESINEDDLTAEERMWRNDILWFWYHHAISCATWKGNKEKMREFATKALEYQDNDHPNILTRTMFFLAHDRVHEAEEWVLSQSEAADYETGVAMVEDYKKYGHW